jgi:hypothetical protein
MSDVRWDLIAQYPNAGQGFADAFQGGMQKNAINALMMNPNDPKALAGYAQYDPKGALTYSLDQRKQERQFTADEHKAWVVTAAKAAKMAKTPELRDQIVDYYVSHGYPEAAQIKQIPAEQWPAARAALMAQGGEKDDEPQADPGIIREYDIAKQRRLIPADTTYGQYVTMRNPGSQTPVVLGHNDQLVSGGGSTPPTATGPNGEKVQYNAQTGQWEPLTGGAGGNASGGFPGY